MISLSKLEEEIKKIILYIPTVEDSKFPTINVIMIK
jgi:hypothetical protein